MPNDQQVLSLLGMARKAQKLVTGESFVLEAIRNHEAKFVFMASDAGASTAKQFNNKTTFYEVPINQAFTKDQLSQAIGSMRTTIAVTDSGFAKKFGELTR